jgi:hypothetical protein
MVEELVDIYGEEYRLLIEDSLCWLDEREKVWNLLEPIDRRSFIADLVSKAEA